MKKILITFIAIINIVFLHAQTGIGTTSPNASAKLDVYSTNKGFLPPRVTLTSATDATTIASPAEGLLVYNLGSVGLQAGYYYWNNANWATIATATSAGNGVTASDLVKLYQEVYSTTTGKAPSADGYSFTVPVSGRYEFNFNSTGWNSNGSTIKLTFNVRQGATVLGTDYHQSTSSNVWVEYEGRVEVNLTAGVTYNAQVVTTTGNRDSRDWDKIMYKLVAGNLPVTGQSVEYGIARYTGADGSAIADVAIVPFDATASGNLTWSSNKFTLKANKTYELESSLAIYISNSAPGVAGRFQIYDYTNNVALASGLFMSQNGAGSNGQSANSPMKGVITPATDIQVGIRLLDHYGANGPSIIGNAATTGVQSAPNASYFMVKQIGSSAIINPWTLSGTSTYNTTGNVGIGNNAPAATLDVTGSLAVSGAATFKDIVEIGTGIGDEGGEFQFAIPATNTTLQNRVKVDVSKDRLRFFEGSNNAKGVNIDLSKAPNGAAGELIWKVSGIINTGSFVQLDNLKAGPTRNGAGGGYAGLSIGAVSTTFVANVSATYSNSTIGGTTATTVTYTTTVSNSAFGWGFTEGHASTYILNDTTNSRVYRITLQIGASYNNNFISIERLY